MLIFPKKDLINAHADFIIPNKSLIVTSNDRMIAKKDLMTTRKTRNYFTITGKDLMSTNVDLIIK